MRAILWSINYAPEATGIAPYVTELAEHLQAGGSEVSVITGFPYYPGWRKLPGDRGCLYRNELINGVSVHRCWLHVPARASTVRRVVHEASFVLTSFWRALWMKRPDIYVVVSPPLGLGVAAAVLSFFKRSPVLLHVQDLQPDSASGLGMLKPGLFLRFLQACERLAYRGAAGVAGISAGMVAAFAAKGVPEEKIFLLPNWRRGTAGAKPVPGAASSFRAYHGIDAGAFLAVYSGNLGRKQGLEILLDAAEVLENGMLGGRPIVILIAGDGAERASLAARLRKYPLANVRLLPLLPDAAHAAMLAAADVALITQASGTGQVCFPSKLLSVLAAGRPVISAADEISDLAGAVREGGFGRNVPAGDGAALAAALREAARDPALVQRWTSHTTWVERFSPAAMLGRFEVALRHLAGTPAERASGVLSAAGRNQL